MPCPSGRVRCPGSRRAGSRVATRASTEEQGAQAHCPRCGFTPRAPRTTCPSCARALVTGGSAGTDAGRSSALLVVLGVGFALATGALLVLNAIDSDTDPVRMGAGMPRLAPPDSGILGGTESDGKKDRREGEKRSGELEGGIGRERDGAESDADPSGNGAERSAVERSEGAGDLAGLPPLLPPIGSDEGSDEPGGGPPVPPLGDLPGMPPALAPVADVGGDSSDDDDPGAGDSDDDRDGEHTVVLASGTDETILAVARTASLAISRIEPEVPVGVFEACGISDHPDGELIAFAGRFDVERNANDLLDRLRVLGFGEGVLFAPRRDDDGDRCLDPELVDAGGGDGIELIGDFSPIPSGGDSPGDGDEDSLSGSPPDSLGDVLDTASDAGSADDGEPRADEENEAEETSAEPDEDADERAPTDRPEPGQD